MLKDWKKESEDLWKNRKRGESIIIYEAYSNFDSNKLVHKVQIGGDGGISDYERKEFKTKSQAIRYARNYMRTH